MKPPDDKKARGIYDKFIVRRTDGQSYAGKKHHGCSYFVLDLDHDPFARAAILAYAMKCGIEYPKLADDLTAKAAKMGEWMVQRQMAAMTPEERERWASFVHNDPERR